MAVPWHAPWVAAVALFFCLLPSNAMCAAAHDDYQATIRPFIEHYCVDCHGPDKSKGDFRLDTLGTDLSDPKSLEAWSNVRERLRDGEMPPRKKTQPPDDSKRAVMDWLAKQIRQQPNPPLACRRLNRVEYENTLRDLLGLPQLEVKEMLQADGTSRSFDTLATGLDISYVQMSRYLDAADIAVGQAITLGMQPQQPAKVIQRHYPQHCGDWWGRASGGACVPLAADGPDPQWNIETGTVRPGSNGRDVALVKAMGTFFHSDPAGLLRLFDDRKSIRVAGHYRLRISAYAFNWDQGKLIPATTAQSFAVTTATRTLGYFDAPKDKPSVSELTAWLEPNDTIFFNAVTLEHGHGTQKGALDIKAQGVAVEWMDVEGPIIDAWPMPARTLLFGDLPAREWTPTKENTTIRPRRVTAMIRPEAPKPYTVISENPKADATRLLKTFAGRAFRRPVAENELAPFVALFELQLAEKASFEDSMRTAYKAVLCAPQFLFLRTTPGKPDLYALASRLSYFLWSSMPDDELMRTANDGTLAKPEVLAAQANRLLADPRSQRFIENFTGQWLKLRDINATQPDRQLYPEPEWESDVAPYICDSMVAETRKFVSMMVEKDLGISNVIDSNFAWVNEPLAKLYGIPGVTGSALRQVTLPADCKRGGILTQASVLKVSANGTTTSPVLRGNWVNTRLFGRITPPPPASVAAVEPDLRGATTIREQLFRHRADAACASCHAGMEPPGFALEGYDVVGAVRTRYRILQDKDVHREPPLVDASGQTLDGRAFKDITEFKQIALSNQDQLARSLAMQLLTYATGRPGTAMDRLEIDDIVDQLRPTHHGVRSILHAVIQSRGFRGDQ